jgi:hypothetical protein
MTRVEPLCFKRVSVHFGVAPISGDGFSTMRNEGRGTMLEKTDYADVLFGPRAECGHYLGRGS